MANNDHVSLNYFKLTWPFQPLTTWHFRHFLYAQMAPGVQREHCKDEVIDSARSSGGMWHLQCGVRCLMWVFLSAGAAVDRHSVSCEYLTSLAVQELFPDYITDSNPLTDYTQSNSPSLSLSFSPTRWCLLQARAAPIRLSTRTSRS